MTFAYLLAQYRGLPIVGLILFALIGIYGFITQRTVTGRHVYAIGGNVRRRHHVRRHAPGASTSW